MCRRLTQWLLATLLAGCSSNTTSPTAPEVAESQQKALGVVVPGVILQAENICRHGIAITRSFRASLDTWPPVGDIDSTAWLRSVQSTPDEVAEEWQQALKALSTKAFVSISLTPSSSYKEEVYEGQLKFSIPHAENQPNWTASIDIYVHAGGAGNTGTHFTFPDVNENFTCETLSQLHERWELAKEACPQQYAPWPDSSTMSVQMLPGTEVVFYVQTSKIERDKHNTLLIDTSFTPLTSAPVGLSLETQWTCDGLDSVLSTTNSLTCESPGRLISDDTSKPQQCVSEQSASEQSDAAPLELFSQASCSPFIGSDNTSGKIVLTLRSDDSEALPCVRGTLKVDVLPSD